MTNWWAIGGKGTGFGEIGDGGNEGSVRESGDEGAVAKGETGSIGEKGGDPMGRLL